MLTVLNDHALPTTTGSVTKHDKTLYYYDYISSSDQLNSSGEQYSKKGNYTPSYLIGKLCKVETMSENNVIQLTGWYSYNQLGQYEWYVSKFGDLTYTTYAANNTDYDALYRSFDYSYNNRWLLSKVEHQKHITTEYVDREYTYDNNGQLKKEVLKRNGSESKTEYLYFETGALKRKILDGDLQGIDFTYTIRGQLKAINHPSLDHTKDPGGDNPGNNGFEEDVFGMVLDYHTGDYTRSSVDFGTRSQSHYSGG